MLWIVGGGGGPRAHTQKNQPHACAGADGGGWGGARVPHCSGRMRDLGAGRFALLQTTAIIHLCW